MFPHGPISTRWAHTNTWDAHRDVFSHLRFVPEANAQDG